MNEQNEPGAGLARRPGRLRARRARTGGGRSHRHLPGRSTRAARWERALRDAAGEFGAAATVESDPPSDLRERVLGAARAGRAPPPWWPAPRPSTCTAPSCPAWSCCWPTSPRRVGPAAGPARVRGWTVHDLAALIAANESLLADHPGRSRARRGRDRAGQRRTHRRGPGPPSGAAARAAVGELELAAEAVDQEAQARGEARLDERVEWWDGPTALRAALLVRAFETWTHATTCGAPPAAPMVAPPEQSLRTMASAACGFIPAFLAAGRCITPGGWCASGSTTSGPKRRGTSSSAPSARSARGRGRGRHRDRHERVGVLPGRQQPTGRRHARLCSHRRLGTGGRGDRRASPLWPFSKAGRPAARFPTGTPSCATE